MGTSTIAATLCSPSTSLWIFRLPRNERSAAAVGIIEARDGGRMPLAIVGTDEMVPIEYTLPVASAQVKSCILLAGLNTAGETTVIEPEATRDHTERMLRHFGAEVRVSAVESGRGKRITVVGWPELKARDIAVPGDPSSAAFAVVAAAVKDVLFGLPEQRAYVAALRESGQHLLSLVNDVLDFAKLGAARIDLACAPVDIDELLRSVCELVAPRAQEKGVEVAWAAAPGLATFAGDEGRLRPGVAE